METLIELRRRHVDEREALLKAALLRTNGNQLQAAKLIGMDRTAFIQDFKKYVMMRPAEFMQKQERENG